MHPPSHWLAQRCASDTCFTIFTILLTCLCTLQPQCKKMAHAFIVSARVVQNGKHILLQSSHTHPHLSKSGSICLLTVTCFQIKLACNRDLLACSKSVAWVGGIFSNERLLVKNKLYLASLICSTSTQQIVQCAPYAHFPEPNIPDR